MAEYLKYYQVDRPGSFSGVHSFQKALLVPLKEWVKREETYINRLEENFYDVSLSLKNQIFNCKPT